MYKIIYEVTFMLYLGVDLGGTNIAIGIVDQNGKILHKGSVPTPSTGEYKDVVAEMINLSKSLISDNGYKLSDFEAVGIGCPGSIDYKKGSVAYSNNLRFDDAPIAEEFKKHWNIPVILENDANAAAYGEYMINGDNADVFVAITLGTGVGGGVIIDGKIFTGANGAGAELGHSVLVHDGLSCTCGRKGCWEAYASATALVKQTKVAIEKHPESLMAQYAKERGKVNGRTAFDAAKKGDAAAQEVVDKYIKYVADGIVNMVNIFQPNKIVIGGGISNEGEYLLAPIREYVKKYDYNKLFTPAEIGVATLFNDAGIIGAALAAKNFK